MGILCWFFGVQREREEEEGRSLLMMLNECAHAIACFTESAPLARNKPSGAPMTYAMQEPQLIGYFYI